jgi:hypothetical protein
MSAEKDGGGIISEYVWYWSQSMVHNSPESSWVRLQLSRVRSSTVPGFDPGILR